MHSWSKIRILVHTQKEIVINVKNKVFKPSGDWIKKSHVDSLEKYEKIYHDSVSNPDEFWGTIADRLNGTKNGIVYRTLIIKKLISNGF